MSEQNKTAFTKELKRCVDVIEGELENLADWVDEADSQGRSARCSSRLASIRSSSRRKLNALAARANRISAAKVTSAPTPAHRTLIVANERSLAARKNWNINALGNFLFTRALRRASDNSKDALADATVIFRECT